MSDFCISAYNGCYVQIYRIVREIQLRIHAKHLAVDRLNVAENNQNMHMQRSKNSAKCNFIYYIVML